MSEGAVILVGIGGESENRPLRVMGRGGSERGANAVSRANGNPSPSEIIRQPNQRKIGGKRSGVGEKDCGGREEP